MTSGNGTRELYRYFFLAYPRRTVIMVFMMVLAGMAEGVGVMTLLPVLQVADPASAGKDNVGAIITHALAAAGLPSGLSALLVLIVFAITLKAVFLLLAQRQVGFTVAGVVRDLQFRLLRSLFAVNWSFFGQRTVGQFTNSVMTESVRSATAYGQACALVAAVLQMAAYFLIALLISWKIALVALVASLGLILLARYFIAQSRRAGQAQTDGSRNLSSRIVDVLQGIKPLKAMNKQGLVWPQLEHEAELLNRASRRQVSASQALNSFQEPILTVLLALGIFFTLTVSGRSLTSMLVLAFVFYRLMVHVNTLQMRYQVMVVGESAFLSLWSSLQLAEAQRESLGGVLESKGLAHELRMEDVHFAYADKSVLNGVDLTVKAGSFVAIHGESGCGKTTLADLIVGLYRPQRGRILVDGVALEQFSTASWRDHIGYVPQETLLFNESILMNVTLRDPAFSREDAERALRMAGAWDFVAERAEGIDDIIGERGEKLSGGQRQRIAIARALVGNPPLLILDEVTTALDPETERAICETLGSLAGEVTVLSISHQPAMLAAAEVAWTMRAGRLEPTSLG